MGRIRASATALTAATACAALLAGASSAYAGTSYESDICSSSGDKYCFRLHYSSRSSQTWVSHGSCFLSNASVPNAWGYSPNQSTVVRYVFDYHSNTCYDDDKGHRQAINHNAASGSNDDPSHSYNVFSSTSYSGYTTYIPRRDGIAHNLASNVKNKNESQRRN
ncbi:hypothetical protein [Streptomyces sp. CL12]|uniref:hypothetical protein n=1 Tax=Streptomyces sp. CL12 TaxID=3391744 RepID=UPI003A804F73